MSSLFYLVVFGISSGMAYLGDEAGAASHRFKRESSGRIVRTDRHYKKSGRLFVASSALILMLVRGLRYGIASDYFYTYVPRFETALHGGRAKGDLIYDGFIWLCAQLSNDFRVFFFIDSLLFIALVFVSIELSNSNRCLSVLLFCMSYNFLRSFQFQAQYMAMAITLLAIVFVQRGYNIPSLALLIIAVGTHVSAALMALPLAICIMCNRLCKSGAGAPKKSTVLFLAIAIPLACLFFRQITPPLMSFVAKTLMGGDGSRFTFYLGSKYDDGQFSGYLFAVNAAVLIFMMAVLLGDMREIDPLKSSFLLCQSLTLGFCFLSGIVPLMYRFIFYLAFPQILSIPYYLGLIREPNYRLLIGSLIVACFAAVQFGYLMPADSDIVFTYRSVFGFIPSLLVSAF